jgi:deoxyribonuclease-4
MADTMELYFGPAGVPQSAPERTTEGGIRYVALLGLGGMEMQFVRGVKMGETAARAVGKVAKEKGIALSAHGPYYINLNARESEKIAASQERLLDAVRIASLCGARSVVFHAAFYLNDPPDKVYPVVKKNLQEVRDRLKLDQRGVWLRPEVTGKATQFGTLEEVLRLSSELEGVAPCIDFAHLHARTGKSNSYAEFAATLEQIERKLGRAALDNMHIHISGIKYGEKGEIKHLDLQDSDFDYVNLIRALKDFKVRGLVISESPDLERDALLLQQTYRSLS